MRQVSDFSDGGREHVRDAYGKMAQEDQREREALASLHRSLIELSEHNVRLHRQNLATLQSITKDLERFKQQLKRLARARA